MDLQGCYVAIVTPFDADGGIDEKALRSHINFLIDKGVAGIVPCGTTGESATMSWEEHNRVVDITIDEVKTMIDTGESILFIDTRNQHDWSESSVKLPGARRIHVSELRQHIDELPRDRLIVTYCT